MSLFHDMPAIIVMWIGLAGGMLAGVIIAGVYLLIRWATS